MNIVNSGDRYMIYGEDVKTYKKLPAETYQVGFSPMSGFYLTLHNDLHVNEKVDKVLQTFRAFNRNMGVILSGPKGVGKSMFCPSIRRFRPVLWNRGRSFRICARYSALICCL